MLRVRKSAAHGAERTKWRDSRPEIQASSYLYGSTPDAQTRGRTLADDALSIIAKEVAFGAGRVTSVVRQGGIYHEVLEEAKEYKADLIVMSSHRVRVRASISSARLPATWCATPIARCWWCGGSGSSRGFGGLNYV